MEAGALSWFSIPGTAYPRGGNIIRKPLMAQFLLVALQGSLLLHEPNSGREMRLKLCK